MAFHSFTDILRIARSKYPGFSKRMAEAGAVARWEQAVGKQIAKHAQVQFVKDSILFVQVKHPIWRTELHHRKHQILKILNEPSDESEKKKTVIVDIVFIDERGAPKLDDPARFIPKKTD